MSNRKGILGKKVEMTRIFTESGEIVPVTVIEAGPAYVTQIKTPGRDGYSALQVGVDPVKKLNKPERGHLKDLPSVRTLREIRTDDVDEYQLGQVLDVSMFSPGDLVDVTGTSKGKGFAGVMKRHHFKGGPITHGQSDRQRATGSIGSGTTPGRVYKGMRGPGQMGNKRITVHNLEVVLVDPERNMIALKGAVPGPRGGLLMIRNAVKS